MHSQLYIQYCSVYLKQLKVKHEHVHIPQIQAGTSGGKTAETVRFRSALAPGVKAKFRICFQIFLLLETLFSLDLSILQRK